MKLEQLLAAGLACACELVGCDSGAQSGISLPSLMQFEAYAYSVVDDNTIECRLNYLLELTGEMSRSATRVEYIGTMGGEANRSILRPDLSGFAIVADAFSEVRVVHSLPDTVEITAINVPPSVPGSESRFWDNQLRFVGQFSPPDLIDGSWVCGPLDTEIGGILDDTYAIDGTWFTTATE